MSDIGERATMQPCFLVEVDCMYMGEEELDRVVEGLHEAGAKNIESYANPAYVGVQATVWPEHEEAVRLFLSTLKPASVVSDG